MKKRILPKNITADDLPPAIAEIVERTQILLDQATDEYNRAADRCTECLYQLRNTIELCSEAHLKVEQASANLASYATKSQLVYAIITGVIVSVPLAVLAVHYG